MTDLNNTNDDEERPNDESHGGVSPSDNLDAAWAEFANSHADDLKAVERSRSAKRFEKHAQRQEKEALLSVNDLDQGTFVGDMPSTGRGPRDFTGSSWLDTDRVMDRYGEDFVPPNPKIGPVKLSKLVFWVLLVAGVIGIIASVFMPALASILGSIFGLCALIGAPDSLCSIRDIPRHAPTNSMMVRASDDGSHMRPGYSHIGRCNVKAPTLSFHQCRGLHMSVQALYTRGFRLSQPGRSQSTYRAAPLPCRNRRSARQWHKPP